MKNHLLLFALVISALGGCKSESKPTGLIDYQKLEKIQTELLMEIGESESFLPGRLNDLVVAPDGSMLVSDWASITIEQFDSTGKHVATIAKEGGGPGELTSYFDMRDLGNGTVLVSHRGGQRDFWEKSENGLFGLVRSQVPEERSERPITIISAHSDTTFYATTGRVIRNVQQILKNEIDYSMIPLVIVDSSYEIIIDSLYTLKDPASHFTRINGGFRFDDIPYRYEDYFIPMKDGNYMIARPDSSDLLIFNSNHKLHKRIPLKVKPRPVTEADIEYALKEKEESISFEIEKRVHEIKPPYLNIWASENYIWLHTDTDEKGKEIVVLDYDGEPLGKFLLPSVDEIHHIEEKKIYTINRNPQAGNTIRVYNVGI